MVKVKDCEVGVKLRLLIVISIFLSLSLFKASAQEVLKINVEGRVLQDEKNLEGATITLLLNNQQISQTTTGKNGKFSFVADGNKDYIVKASKEGFYSKMVIISTVGITNITYKGWDITLIEKVEGVPGEVFNEPVGRIFYNKERNSFDYDVDFENKIKPQLNLFHVELAKKKTDQAYNNAVQAKEEEKPEEITAQQKSDNVPIKKEVVVTKDKSQIVKNDPALTEKRPEKNYYKRDEPELLASLTEGTNPGKNSAKSSNDPIVTTEKTIEILPVEKTPNTYSFNKEEIETEKYKMLKITLDKGYSIVEYRRIQFFYGTYYKKNETDISETLFNYETQNFR